MRIVCIRDELYEVRTFPNESLVCVEVSLNAEPPFRCKMTPNDAVVIAGGLRVVPKFRGVTDVQVFGIHLVGFDGAIHVLPRLRMNHDQLDAELDIEGPSHRIASILLAKEDANSLAQQLEAAAVAARNQ